MNESQTTDLIFIRKLTDIILANLGNENFGVNELALESGLSLYRLNRKLHSIKRKTTNQFIREIRLGRALEMLQNEEYSAAEVAYRIGFGSPTYFTKIFHDFYGYPPGKVKKRDPNISESDIEDQVSANIKQEKPVRRIYILALSVFLLVLLAGTIGFLVYRSKNKPEWTDRLISSGNKISFAVMPFQNITGDTSLNKWQYWIQWSLISSLANTGELKVRQIETVRNLLETHGMTEYAAIPPGIAGTISKKLEADMFIYGNLQHAGSRIRIDAQIIETKTNEVLQSFETNGPYGEEIIFDLTDSLRKKITDFLVISRLIQENLQMQHLYTPTRSAAAVKNFISGDKAYNKKDYAVARKHFLNALAADSNFNLASLMIEKTYAKEDKEEEKFKWLIRNYGKRDLMPYAEQLYASWAYAFNFESPEERLKYLKRLQDIDDQEPSIPYLLGYTYNRADQFDKAIPELEKSLQISRRWGREYLKDVGIYLELGDAYHKTGQYRKEKKLYRMAEKYIPDEPWLIRFQARLALTEKDSIEAERYLDKYKTILKNNLSSEGTIAAGLAWIFSMSGIPDKAEEYYRKSVQLEPMNPLRLQNFASFLINKNRHLDEVPGLMDRAMEIAPDKYNYYNYSDTKGWGLYKQGKYQEALEVLEKTWNEAPYKLYSIRSHLEEVRKTVAGQ